MLKSQRSGVSHKSEPASRLIRNPKLRILYTMIIGDDIQDIPASICSISIHRGSVNSPEDIAQMLIMLFLNSNVWCGTMDSNKR